MADNISSKAQYIGVIKQTPYEKPTNFNTSPDNSLFSILPAS